MTEMLNAVKMRNSTKVFPNGWNLSVVAGDSAETDIPITGIKTTDVLMSVIEIAATTIVPTDRTATSAITSAGNIQCTDDTTGDVLLVYWWDKG